MGRTPAGPQPPFELACVRCAGDAATLGPLQHGSFALAQPYLGNCGIKRTRASATGEVETTMEIRIRNSFTMAALQSVRQPDVRVEICLRFRAVSNHAAEGQRLWLKHKVNGDRSEAVLRARVVPIGVSVHNVQDFEVLFDLVKVRKAQTTKKNTHTHTRNPDKLISKTKHKQLQLSFIVCSPFHSLPRKSIPGNKIASTDAPAETPGKSGQRGRS